MVNQVVDISVFHIVLTLPQGKVCLLTLYPVKGLKVCIAHTPTGFVNIISEAYSGQGPLIPTNLVAHSTRRVATSWAALKGVPLSFQKSVWQ